MVTELLYEESQRRFLFLTLDTQVRNDGLYVKLWPLHWSFNRIPFDDVDDVSVNTYSPSEFGGWAWGMRIGPSLQSVAYRMRGDDGVRITRKCNRDVFLGSQSPEALADAIRRAGDLD